MKIGRIALLAAAIISFAPVAAQAQVCGIGVIIAAFVANGQEHRELTQQEANSCGLMYGQDRQNIKPKKINNKVKAKPKKKS